MSDVYAGTGSAAACTRCHSPLEAGDLRCAICALPTPHQTAGAAQIVAEVLRCEQCGAALEYDVRAQAPKCGFCGGVAKLERSEDPIERAELYLPFRVDPNTAQQALQRWLASLGWFRPSDLSTGATLHSLKPLWWVGWTFDCQALVSWTADSNAGAGRSAWAPHAGQSPLSMRAVLVSASRGLTREETSVLTPHFDLASAQPQPHEMPDALIERFDVQRSAARSIVAEAVKDLARANARQWIPGTTYRNLNVAVLLKGLVTRRFAFPSYVLAYRYKGELYRAIVHGQDAGLVIGKAPYSLLKILLVVFGVLAALGIAGVTAWLLTQR
ncbi:MAG: zinc ribbon domain-containing protein [Sandaracinaceae bacterium]